MLALVLAVPFMLGAKADKWVQVAEHDLEFAKVLAGDGVRFGPRFMDEVIKGRVFEFGCNPRPSRMVGLDEAQARAIELYSDHHCNPWHEAWAHELYPCEGRLAPKWCKTDDEKIIASHLKIGPYFDRLTQGLRGTSDPLVRYNIMAVLADRLRDEILRDYPHGVLGTWTATASAEYLQDAKLGDALGIGWFLSWVPYVSTPPIAEVFHRYLDRVPDAPRGERHLLALVVGALEGRELSTDTRSVLVNRFGPRPPSAPPPDRTDPEQISLLESRVDLYYAQIRNRTFGTTWDLVALDYREATDHDSYVATEKSCWRQTRLLGWRLKGVRIKGDVAHVVALERHSERAGLFTDKEVVKEGESFWIFENNSWYNMVRWPPDWEDSEAVEVHLPSEAP